MQTSWRALFFVSLWSCGPCAAPPVDTSEPMPGKSSHFRETSASSVGLATGDTSLSLSSAPRPLVGSGKLRRRLLP